MDIRIYPPEEMIEAAVRLPLSKSISNRYLIINALTPGGYAPVEVAACNDTDAMVAALMHSSGEINVGPAGTAMRFLTAYFAAKEGCLVTLDGNERMRRRPIGPLVDALRQCGADIEYAGEEGFPPLRIKGARLHGGEMNIDASISSQFISALLMVAPTFSSPLTLNLEGEAASLPYLKMTLEMMRRHGIDAELYRDTVTVKPGTYLHISDEKIERDWTAASYWYEICALSAGWITLEDMSLPSLQGDSALAEIFPKLGVISEPDEENAENLSLNPYPDYHSHIELDLADNPDIAQTLVVTCCMLDIPFRFSGLKSLYIKETDRIEALRRELAKLSYNISVEADGVLTWHHERIPVQRVQPIDTYGDHRMAMAFAPAALFISGLQINDAEVVAKSYPDFWRDMESAGFRIEEVK